jgi:hypothetical protein
VVPIEDARSIAGLCANCSFVKMVCSDRGKRFYQCGKSFEDARFPKYPCLPVRTCPAYAPMTEAELERRRAGDRG